MEKEFRIFAQNLAYYNEGYLVGGWIDLPQIQENIKKYLKDIVKIDEEHEEYEIADVDNVPFEYSCIQWASVQDVNNLAIIYSTLDKFQRAALETHLNCNGTDRYGITELINICLQVDEISYYEYNFDGIENSQYLSAESKMGYTMAEENGLYADLDRKGILDYFDFEKYGENYGYDYELSEDGYLISDYEIDLKYYSKDEIQEKVNEILKENLENKENLNIEI